MSTAVLEKIPLLSASQRSTRVHPRLGFLGVGWIGRHRLEALAGTGEVTVAAIADPAKDLARQAAESAPHARIVSSLDELLGLDLDGVVIATPSALHAEQCITALENGLSVFCQKPMARTRQETNEVIAAARKADRLLGVDFSYRFLEETQHVRELVQNGELGEIFAAELVFHNAYGPDKPWFYDAKQSGGGCVIDLGIHLVDMALWVLDYPSVANVSSRLFAQGQPVRGRGRTVEDFASAQIELTNGTVIQLACSWKLHAGRDAVISGTFHGTKGGAAFRNVNGSFYDFVAEHFRGTTRERLAATSGGWGGRAAVDWAQRLATSSRYDPQVEGVLRVAEVLDRIYED